MIEVTVNPERRDWPRLVERALSDDGSIKARVEKIITDVAENGDEALLELSRKFDNVILDRVEVSGEVIAEAAALVDKDLKEAIALAAENIRRFHTAVKPQEISTETMPGVKCIQKPVPLGRAGIYIPGGTAPLFSTVLMLAIPAKVAGVKEVILCTPAGRNGRPHPAVLYAASVCGVDRVFAVGGAQAVAAMAYGTRSVPRVDKIFGPGNRYVTYAKQLVAASITAVDMPAGPSEVMVLADGSSEPAFVAADLLSQAEHGTDSQAILVCDSRSFAERTLREVETQLTKLPRASMAMQSLDNSRIIVMDTRSEMVDFANEYGAEHLIISVEDPWEAAGQIINAGSIFIGNYSPESAGDYASGTNHTLPTAGWARSYSGVNTESFMKKITIQELSRQGLAAIAGTVTTMAEAEGLQAHSNAVKLRIDNYNIPIRTNDERSYHD